MNLTASLGWLLFSRKIACCVRTAVSKGLYRGHSSNSSSNNSNIGSISNNRNSIGSSSSSRIGNSSNSSSKEPLREQQ
ncbi:hypothetical protein Emag_000774 [Eimeria magna]